MGDTRASKIKEWASLRGDVDVARGQLVALRLQAQRLVEDLDRLLGHPPFKQVVTRETLEAATGRHD